MYRIGKEEIEAVARVIESQRLFKSTHPDSCQETLKCEELLKEMFDCPNVIVMTSGKAALISALTALGIGPGDEVIVPAYTYIATAMAVTAVGAIPVICEVDETLTLSPEDVEKKISPYTKAMIPVHIMGFPCNMDALCEIAKKHNLFILEDSAQSDGGSYHGKRLGTIGDAGALSFNQYKIICSGEGGAMFARDKEVYNRALIYHDASAIAYLYGDGAFDDVDQRAFCGVEYRTNEVNAAILRQQLLRLDGILADLRKNKKRIVDAISDMYTIAPSNDSEGDCATTLAIRFDTAAETEAFTKTEGLWSWSPINTGKHVYRNWTSIMEKYGAYNPKMDPFKMKENEGRNFNYTLDMCPKTLDYLERTAYIGINPDWTEEEIEEVIRKIRAAKK